MPEWAASYLPRYEPGPAIPVNAREPLLIPLCDGARDVTAVVNPGDHIRVGQIVARAPATLRFVHSACDGRVECQTRAWTVGRGWVAALRVRPSESPALEIADPPAPIRPSAPTGSVTRGVEPLSPDAPGIADRLWPRVGDIRDDDGRPLSDGARAARAAGVKTMILRAFDSEPGLMVQRMHARDDAAPDRAMLSAFRLAETARIGRIRVAVSNAAPRREVQCWRQAIRRVAANRASPIDAALVAVDDTHPAAVAAVLARTIRGPKSGTGRTADSFGAWVVALDALCELAEGLSTGMARRTVTLVAGAADASARAFAVPIGTPIAPLMRDLFGDRPHHDIVANGWLTGTLIETDRAVVTPDVAALWLFPRIDRIRSAPCIRCGDCVEACPVNLLPARLYDAVVRGHAAAGDRLGLLECVGCGMCSAACPARLPLTACFVEAQRSRAAPADPRPDGETGRAADPDAPPEHALPLAHDKATSEFPSAVPTVLDADASDDAVVVPGRDGPARDGSARDDPAREAPEPVSGPFDDVSASPAAAAVPTMTPPRVRSVRTSETIYRDWWIAALLPAMAGVVFFGFAAFRVMAVSVIAALLAEWVTTLRRKPTAIDADYRHAGLMGLLLGLTLPANAPIAAPLIGACAAMWVGSWLLGGVGRYVWQPALVGRVFVQFLFAADLSLGVGLAQSPVLAPGHLLFGRLENAATLSGAEYQGWSDSRPTPIGAHAISVRRPVQELRTLADGNVPASGPDAVMQVMRDQMPPWEDTLIGVVPGGIGETSAFVLILAGIVLVVRGVLPWQLPVAALTSAALACAVLPIRIGPEQTWIWAPAWILARGEPVGMVYMLYHMTAGQLLLGVTLLAADPSVSPLTRTGMIRYGLIIGLSTVLMRLYGVLDGECYWSILAANTVAARLDPLRSRR